MYTNNRIERTKSNRVANVACGNEARNIIAGEPPCECNYKTLLSNIEQISDYKKHFDWWLFPCITKTYEKFNYNLYDQSQKNSVSSFFTNFTKILQVKTKQDFYDKNKDKFEYICNNGNNDEITEQILEKTDIRIALIARAIPQLLDQPYNIRLGKILQHLDFTLQSLKKKSPKLFNTYKQIIKEHIIDENPTLERHLNENFKSFRLLPYKQNYQNLVNICNKKPKIKENNNGNARTNNRRINIRNYNN